MQALQEELDAVKSENVALRTALEKAKKTGVASVPVTGKVKLSLETPDGKKETLEVGFKAGRTLVALDTGVKVPTEAFLRICNGKSATKEEKEQYPALIDLSKEAALARLTWLVSVKASMIEIAAK